MPTPGHFHITTPRERRAKHHEKVIAETREQKNKRLRKMHSRGTTNLLVEPSVIEEQNAPSVRELHYMKKRALWQMQRNANKPWWKRVYSYARGKLLGKNKR